MGHYVDRNGFRCTTGTGTPTMTRPEGRVVDIAPEGPSRRCALCNTNGVATRHHLTPQSVGGRVATVWLCPYCHNFVHHEFTIDDLEGKYYTLELLAAAPGVAEHVEQRQIEPTTGPIVVY